MIDLVQTLQMVLDWTREVGKIQLGGFRQKNLKIDIKANPSDLVTEIDRLSEKYIIDRIKQHFPTHSILAEESGFAAGQTDHLWTIDPLDGTNNFAQGIPIFAVSIAYSYRGQTQLGVVYAPYLDETYSAILGRGAHYNHEKISVGTKQTLDRSVVATGFPYTRNEIFEQNLTYLVRLAPKIGGLRRLGAAAYDLSLVASGRLDGFWELNLCPWDVAAGVLIVKEAGGLVIDLDDTGPDKPSIIAANPVLAAEIKKTITAS